jgi:hypothetical protein
MVWNSLLKAPKPEDVLSILLAVTPETVRLSLRHPNQPKGRESYLLMLENPNDARCDMYGAWGM